MTKRLHPDPDLEALIHGLNESARKRQEADATETTETLGTGAPEATLGHAATRGWPLDEATDEGREWLTRLLDQARQARASDLMLVVGAPPMARVSGELTELGKQRLSVSAASALCSALVPQSRRRRVESDGAVDFALAMPGLGRFRCNVHRERDHWAAALRFLPEMVPDFAELNLPPSLARFADLEHGLVLVTGPTGSGKSTTLAALIRQILSRRSVHLITIEDPVEYTHAHRGNSIAEHIEVGRDASSFAGALRAALRQDPDVLLIGEMRDPESISIAITAAETGHLVLSTLHTGDAPQTVHRILDSYPGSQMETVRVQLSISLAGVISQQLLPRKDGAGRVPAVEILMATPAVRNLIRQGKIPLLRSQFALERNAGMLDLDRSLAQLVRDELVDEVEARSRARIPEEFANLVRRGN
jgi:twitching motility protein PilT